MDLNPPPHGRREDRRCPAGTGPQEMPQPETGTIRDGHGTLAPRRCVSVDLRWVGPCERENNREDPMDRSLRMQGTGQKPRGRSQHASPSSRPRERGCSESPILAVAALRPLPELWNTVARRKVNPEERRSPWRARGGLDGWNCICGALVGPGGPCRRGNHEAVPVNARRMGWEGAESASARALPPCHPCSISWRVELVRNGRQGPWGQSGPECHCRLVRATFPAVFGRASITFLLLLDDDPRLG